MMFWSRWQISLQGLHTPGDIAWMRKRGLLQPLSGMHAISPWTPPLDNQASQVRGPPRPSMPRSFERQRGAKWIAIASREKSISLDMQSKLP